MKIAYLILAYNNFKHLQRLIDALSTENTSFYIHVDKRAKAPELKGKIKYAKRINSYWSTFNCVTPTIEMMKEAYKDGNDYFVLLSGQDYPIVSNEEIEKTLSEGKERMWFERNNSPASYNKYFHFLMERRKDSLKHNLLKRIEKLLRPLTKKEIHFFLYKGSTWFGATRECVNYILAVHKVYIKDFKHSRFPEESFFCTIVGNSKFIQNVTMDLTWSHFKNDQCQITTEKEIKIFKNSNYLFARKFTDQSTEVINIVDELRKVKQTSH